MFYHENKYLNYYLITIVSFDNFTFCGTVLLNDGIETSNWFYFLLNTPYYIQIKFYDHKLISLDTAVKNLHCNIKNLQNYTFYYS